MGSIGYRLVGNLALHLYIQNPVASIPSPSLILPNPKIQTTLEALETLGLVAKHLENGHITWYFAELQKAG